MASNSFGTLLRMTTWGESHGKAVGVVIDGCPAGISLASSDIQVALNKRSPGKSPYTSSRKEEDQAEILSGVFEGQTTGTPISILIPNRDVTNQSYESCKRMLRPGHATFTYEEKYGIVDYRGGGRASARETACRVAAGAIANKILQKSGIQLIAYVQQIGSIQANLTKGSMEDLKKAVENDLLFCPDTHASHRMEDLLRQVKEEGDSLGGIVACIIQPVQSGLGDPVYNKLEAMLASAMMSIPGSKGFEIGSGFQAVSMRGSEHNDLFILEGMIQTQTNHAGGVLGGISSGMPIVVRVAFKPTSSIGKQQSTITRSGEKTTFQVENPSRHDPCIAIRAVPVVEAMAALVLADAILMHRSATYCWTVP